MLTVYEWRVLEKDRRGRDRWRLLRWRMTADEAMHWSRVNDRRIECVPASAEVRVSYHGDGVGQHLPPAPGKERVSLPHAIRSATEKIGLVAK